MITSLRSSRSLNIFSLSLKKVKVLTVVWKISAEIRVSRVKMRVTLDYTSREDFYLQFLLSSHTWITMLGL